LSQCGATSTIGQNSGAIEDRRRRRRFYAERAEFLDVQLDGGAVAPGPTGHHKVIDGDVAARQPGIVVK
jgi:hypothetical protein